MNMDHQYPFLQAKVRNNKQFKNYNNKECKK